MTLSQVLRPGPLALRLAAFVILFSSMIALFITAGELTYEYQRDLRQIDSRMEQIRVAYLDSITEDVWVADRERIDTLLQGITRLPDFVLAEIRVDGKTEHRRGHDLSGPGITQAFPLHRMHHGRMQDIGELRVAASYEGAYRRVLDRALFFLVSNGAKTLLVALFIFILYYRLIGSHLAKVSRYLTEHPGPDSGSALTLDRAARGRDDELSSLVTAINYMRGKVQELNRIQEERLDRLEEQAALLDLAHDAILVRDMRGEIIFWNRGAERTYGWTRSEALGKNSSLLLQTNYPRPLADIEATLAQAGTWEGELGHSTQGGARIVVASRWAVKRDAHDVPLAILEINRDITDRRKAEERIEELAHYDILTRLPNRFTLAERLEQAIHASLRRREMLAVMFVDLDRFKTINDSLGHDLGDQMLIQVANRLTSCVRDSDIVARLGGDEFVVALTGIWEVTAAVSMADRILRALSAPYDIGGRDVRSSASIGVAVYPENGRDRRTLLKNADTAMYHAKSQGRNNFQFFTDDLNRIAQERVQLEGALRLAIENQQFDLHYQPQIDGCDGRMVGMEALLRWRNPDDDSMSPLKFIPVAEDMGLIQALGEWALDEACRQLVAWRGQGLEVPRLSVNLSASQFRSSRLLDFIRTVLGRYALSGADLELEITESVLMDEPEVCIDTLNGLRKMGVRLSIDDFGTGYSSLTYLKLLPIQSLKLDRTFVRDIETDANDVAICAATIALAHSLGLTVIAEGVETEQQRSFLLAHRCDVLQGYLYSRPLAPEAVPAFIRRLAIAA